MDRTFQHRPVLRLDENQLTLPAEEKHRLGRQPQQHDLTGKNTEVVSNQPSQKFVRLTTKILRSELLR